SSTSSASSCCSAGATTPDDTRLQSPRARRAAERQRAGGRGSARLLPRGVGGRSPPRETRNMPWLFKTEPSAYSFARLEADGRTVWDGVKNALALRHLAAVATGDEVLVYHTGDEKAAVGIARVARGAYPDPKQKGAKLVVVDLEAVRALQRPVTLAEMRGNAKLAGFDLLRLPRLSVMPVSAAQWTEILRMARG